jgi:hypothetical protein
MRHQKFVVTTTVLMLATAGVVAGLAFYSTHAFTVTAAPEVPEVIHYLPAGSQAVFGMNVQKFIQSPVYQRVQARHGDGIGQDLQDFIAKTGVDPRRDVRYIVGAGRAGTVKGDGVVIAVGSFNTAAITSYINTKGAPIEVPYKKGKVLMIPESDGNKLEKGIAFLSESEIALGDLESLKQVLDIQAGDAAGVDSTNVGRLLQSVNLGEMFWFAGDAPAIASKAPTTPLTAQLSAIQTIYGTLDLTDEVRGKLTATAKDLDSAKNLAAVINGFVALGKLAAQNASNTELKDLLPQIMLNVEQDGQKLNVTMNFPLDVLDKLQQMKRQPTKI